MITTRQCFGLAATLLLAGVIQGCSTMGPQQASASRADDAQINSNVTSALARDPVLAGSDIAATTSNAYVRLTGLVDTRLSRQNAVQTASAVPGVKGVMDDLRLNNGD